MNKELKRLLDELIKLFLDGIINGDTVSCVISWEADSRILKILSDALQRIEELEVEDDNTV